MNRTMNKISVVKARDQMADVLNRVAYSGERIILERRGKGVAAMVSMQDLALLEELEDRQDLKAAVKARKEKGGVTLDQLKAELGF